jgi:hypothetical protein
MDRIHQRHIVNSRQCSFAHRQNDIGGKVPPNSGHVRYALAHRRELAVHADSGIGRGISGAWEGPGFGARHKEGSASLNGVDPFEIKISVVP